MTVRDDIEDVLRDYGCLEWADGAEREEMAPYFVKMMNEIMAAIRKPIETMHAPGIQDSIRLGTRDRVLEMLQ